MEEAPPEGDDAEAREVLQQTAAGLTDAWEDKAALKARLRDLKQLLNIFLKAGKTLRLYDDDHRFFDGFVREFIERLYIQFETLEAVTFEVTPQSINWDGHIIFSNPDQRANMAFKLYRDGIRLLQFRRGCTTDEVEEFVSLVTRDMSRGVKTGEDLSILFWEADFRSIQIAVAETFVDYTEEAAQVLKNIQEDLSTLQRCFELDRTEDGGKSNYEPMAFRGLDGSSQSLHDIKGSTRQVADIDGDTVLKIYQAGGDSGGTEQLIQASPNNPYTPKLPLDIFDETRMQAVYDALQGVDNPVATFEDVGIVLTTVIEAEEDSVELAHLLEHLDDAVSPLLASASLGPLNSILRRLSLIERDPSPHKSFRGEQLRAFFNQLCKSSRLILLSRALNNSWNEELRGELFTFIALQKRDSLEELFRFLGQIDPPGPRRVITDALLLLANRQAEEFTPLVDDGNTTLACDALYALGRIQDSLTLSRICGTFERPEPEVREAVRTTLREFQSPRVHRLMVSALSDPAPNVRIAALRYVTVYKIRDALKPIATAIRSHSFTELDFEERRAWYIALGNLAGSSALPALKKQADPFRGGSQITEEIHLAMLGIKATRSVEGTAWLEEFAGEASDDLELLTRKIMAGRKGGRS